MGSYRSTVKESFSWRQTLQLHHQSPDQKREWGIEAAQLITHTTPSHSTRKYNPSFPHGAAEGSPPPPLRSPSSLYYLLSEEQHQKMVNSANIL
ncbi:hypothetical protein DTO021D3_5699 [Paecilomyces variotii]|nr:hypothetical protein DTO021D3_5699 [Paecilomyces variotii]